MSTNPVRLIVGLGNPGAEYVRSWHNLGFMVVDALRQHEDFRYGDWTTARQGQAELALCTLPGSRLMLAKPQTGMNHSGQAVLALMQEYHLRLDDLWIIHDELDLPLGKLRISRNATAAGHRGVQSIQEVLDTTALVRFRVGIATPARAQAEAEAYVLQPIPADAEAAVQEAVGRTVEAILLAQMSGVTEAMNQCN